MKNIEDGIDEKFVFSHEQLTLAFHRKLQMNDRTSLHPCELNLTRPHESCSCQARDWQAATAAAQ